MANRALAQIKLAINRPPPPTFPASLPGHGQIGALRKAGTEVSEAYTQPMFVYVGDTHISALQANENQFIFDYPVIIVECTFIQGTWSAMRCDVMWCDVCVCVCVCVCARARARRVIYG